MRLTLINRKNTSMLRMNVPPEEKLNEIVITASEAWECHDIVLRSGYSLLDPESQSACLQDNSTVEVLPDPFRDL